MVALFVSTAKSLAAGVPATVSLMVSVTVLVPAVAACAVMVGATPSITRAALAASDPVAPGVGKVSVALLPASSLIVPPLSASAVVPV